MTDQALSLTSLERLRRLARAHFAGGKVLPLFWEQQDEPLEDQ